VPADPKPPISTTGVRGAVRAACAGGWPASSTRPLAQSSDRGARRAHVAAAIRAREAHDLTAAAPPERPRGYWRAEELTLGSSPAFSAPASRPSSGVPAPRADATRHPHGAADELPGRVETLAEVRLFTGRWIIDEHGRRTLSPTELVVHASSQRGVGYVDASAPRQLMCANELDRTALRPPSQASIRCRC